MKTINQFDFVVGQSLRQARKRSRVNACKLGRSMGVHRNTIRRWEIGEGCISLKDFLTYCAAIKASPWSVLPKESAQ